MRKLSKRKDKRPGKKNAVLDSNARMNDFSTSANSLVEQILNLQKTIGNQAVQRLFESGVIQAKLRIGQPGDKYELEADRIAEQVMRMPETSLTCD